MIDNLVANALRVTPAGEQIILQAGLDANGGYLEVRDGGPGLSDSDPRWPSNPQSCTATLPGGCVTSARAVGLALVGRLAGRLGGRPPPVTHRRAGFCLRSRSRRQRVAPVLGRPAPAKRAPDRVRNPRTPDLHGQKVAADAGSHRHRRRGARGVRLRVRRWTRPRPGTTPPPHGRSSPTDSPFCGKPAVDHDPLHGDRCRCAELNAAVTKAGHPALDRSGVRKPGDPSALAGEEFPMTS